MDEVVVELLYMSGDGQAELRPQLLSKLRLARARTPSRAAHGQWVRSLWFEPPPPNRSAMLPQDGAYSVALGWTSAVGAWM